MKRTKVAYGSHPEQFGHLYLPESGVDESTPVVVVIHGGFWSGRYQLNLGTQFAVELAESGAVAWNIEYRRVGAGGMWPEMSADIRAAVDALAGPVQEHAPVSLSDVRIVGHSAGGHLAVWVGGEADMLVRPSRIVSQAGVLDLVTGPSNGHDHPAVTALLGESYAVDPARYSAASPAARVPIGIPVICLHGTDDAQVPPALSERYVAAATAVGDDAVLSLLPDQDHFAFLHPGSAAWQASLAAALHPRG